MAAQAWAVVTAMHQGLRAFDMAKVGSTFHQFSDPYQEWDAILQVITMSSFAAAGGFGAFILGMRLCCCGVGMFLQIPFLLLGLPPSRDPTAVGFAFLLMLSL